MDPIAHTLFGAALAEAGLKKLSRYATATLVLGANLPDIDAVVQMAGSDTALLLRRGWTHGVLALLLLPLLLAGLVWLWHRWRGQQRVGAPPFHLAAIVALAYIGVGSHLLLDWLNTYGVRLLMPFSDSWFYGDTLFIIDPWFWLLSAVGLVVVSTRRRAIAGWLLLAGLATWLVVATPLAPLPVKLVWLAGIAGIALLKWYKPVSGETTTRFGLATLLIYVGAAYGLARLAEAQYFDQETSPRTVQANPQPGNPFAHRVVVVHEDFYQVISAEGERFNIPIQKPDAIVQAALKDESIKGFVHWMRFPYWQVRETPDAWIVEFRDLRYLDPDEEPRGIGSAEVTIPKKTIER